MRGGTLPSIRRITRGAVLAEQGQPGEELYLLDGVLAVSVNGQELGQLGPGAIAGERALLGGGVRTATLRAETDCAVAVAGRDQIDRGRLAELAEPRHREDLAEPMTAAGREPPVP
jgi:CRP-like cAMP-binding protein